MPGCRFSTVATAVSNSSTVAILVPEMAQYSTSHVYFVGSYSLHSSVDLGYPEASALSVTPRQWTDMQVQYFCTLFA